MGVYHRFQGEAAFVQHRRTAKRMEKSPFTAFVAPSADAYWYFAAVASKRLGGAVQRNRAKRRLRAAFAAASKGKVNPLRVILYAKAGVLKIDFQELVESVRDALMPM